MVSTKYRRPIFKPGIGEYLRKIIYQINDHLPDIEIVEVNTDLDHMHILMSIPPKYSVAMIVNKIKANTGRKMRNRFPHLDKTYWGVKGIWSIGYFVSTVGIGEEIIKKYIQMQSKEDSGQAELAF